MIGKIRHKALKRFYEQDDARGLSADMVERLRDILTALDSASGAEGMERPSFRLHALRGDLKGFWAVTVRANWRVIFRFEGENATDIDFIDYH
jgi:proteic killer suppression protein